MCEKDFIEKTVWVHYKVKSVKNNFSTKTVWVHCKVESVENNLTMKTVWNEFITKSTELKVKPVKNKEWSVWKGFHWKNCEFITK